MRLRVSKALILWPTLLLLIIASCGKEKKPRFTPTPISGYPYPFGTDVKRLLGKDRWDTDSAMSCQHPYMQYWLRNPPQDSRWFEYSSVAVTADSAGTLQGFFVARQATGEEEQEKATIQDLLGEIRRRYGSPTDSMVVNGVVLRRMWTDQAGSTVTMDILTGRPAQGAVTTAILSGMPVKGMTLSTASAKLRKECKGRGL